MALGNISSKETFRKIIKSHRFIKEGLEQRGFKLVTKGDDCSPMVVTIKLPESVSSVEIGDLLYYHNYLLHYESKYLRERNWLQIACINNYPCAVLEKLLDLLEMVVVSNTDRGQLELKSVQ